MSPNPLPDAAEDRTAPTEQSAPSLPPFATVLHGTVAAVALVAYVATVRSGVFHGVGAFDPLASLVTSVGGTVAVGVVQGFAPAVGVAALALLPARRRGPGSLVLGVLWVVCLVLTLGVFVTGFEDPAEAGGARQKGDRTRIADGSDT